MPMLSLCCRPNRPSCPGCACLCLLDYRAAVRDRGESWDFCFPSSLLCASVLSVLCSLRLFALSVLFCAISFFHALNCRYQSKRPGLALQISASHLPRIAIAVLLLLFLVRALAAHAHTLTTQYPLFLRLAGSRNPSAYPLPTLTRHLFVSD